MMSLMELTDKAKIHMVFEYLWRLETDLENERTEAEKAGRWFGWDEVQHLEGIIIQARIRQFDDMARVIHGILLDDIPRTIQNIHFV